MTGWTYGAELELSDWPRGEKLPVAGMGIDVRDVTMVNSDGVAVDPRGELYHLGGEILTAPSGDPDGVADQLAQILHHWPKTTVNYRSNLHVHVRIPGLREDLKTLKRLQSYAHRWLPEVLPIIEPIPVPDGRQYLTQPDEAYRGALRRYHRRKVSHQSLLRPARLMHQMQATTIQEFRELEVRHPATGALHWAIHPRLCFNLRQLWETDTIEFRHFPGTVDPAQLRVAVLWCREFLRMAVCDATPLEAAMDLAPRMPKFEPYDHHLETGYKLTSRKYHDALTVRANIVAWLAAEQAHLEGFY